MDKYIVNSDPNSETGRAISRILERDGYVVREAATGEECAGLVSDDCGLAILPWVLPDMGGVDLCTRLKSLNHDLAIVLRVPGEASSEGLPEGADADAYLPSDSGATLLRAAVKNALQHARAVAAHRKAIEAQARACEDLQVFMKRTAHDLAEPIRLVTTFVEMVQQQEAARFTPDEVKYLEYVDRSLQRMRRLMHYLANYAQVGSERRPSFGEVPLEIAVVSALHSLRSQIEAAGMAVDVAKPLPVVHGNLQWLQDLVVHLVGNALKYRTPGSAGSVRIAACQQPATARSRSGEWTVSVADTGIGIAPQYHSRIFRPFERLHGRDVPGNGLGLTICQRIVEAHNGRIWVESAVQQGSTFYFTLPGQPQE